MGGPKGSKSTGGGNSVVDFFAEAFDWSTASQCCEERGGNLLTVSDAEENSVANALQTKGNAAWIGLKYNLGDFQWVDGKAPSYANWASKQPKKSVNGYAAVMRKNGKWSTLVESAKRSFLCSIPM